MLAAIVVLYNPNFEVVNNIKSYLLEIDKLYMVDNSETENLWIKNNFIDSDIEYLYSFGNFGIAAALNIGCEAAIRDGFKWLLTMDQDSGFENINNIKSNINGYENSNIGLFYPQYKIGNEIYNRFYKRMGENIIVMTSGNIINLRVFQEVGEFEEKLFIDYVDVEYCLRLNKLGYRIFQIPNYSISHQLGNTVYKVFFKKKIIITNHNWLRRYYITRNRLYVISKYKYFFTDYFFTDILTFINDFIKVLLFEENKLKKIKYTFKGIYDFIRNKYGKYNSD